MRVACAAGLVVLAFGLAGCNKDGKSGGPKLDGTYVIVGMEMMGEKLPEDLITKQEESKRTVKFAGDKMTTTKNGKDEANTFSLDNSKSPAHITMTGKKADGKEETVYGIYKLEGDTLTICGADSDKADDRPKEFKTAKDSKAMILVLKKKG